MGALVRLSPLSHVMLAIALVWDPGQRPAKVAPLAFSEVAPDTEGAMWSSARFRQRA
jgi:hypothetical protein